MEGAGPGGPGTGGPDGSQLYFSRCSRGVMGALAEEDMAPQHTVWGKVEDSPDGVVQLGRKAEKGPADVQQSKGSARARKFVATHVEFKEDSQDSSSLSRPSADVSSLSSGRSAAEKHLLAKSHAAAEGSAEPGVAPSNREDTARDSLLAAIKTSRSVNHKVWESSNSSDLFDGNEEGAVNQNSPVPSLGSVNHAKGHCKPCLFQHTRIGCLKASGCEFCHYSHKRKDKPRPCKGRRERYRKLMDRMLQLVSTTDGAPAGEAESEGDAAGAGPAAALAAAAAQAAPAAGAAASSSAKAAAPGPPAAPAEADHSWPPAGAQRRPAATGQGPPRLIVGL